MSSHPRLTLASRNLHPGGLSVSGKASHLGGKDKLLAQGGCGPPLSQAHTEEEGFWAGGCPPRGAGPAECPRGARAGAAEHSDAELHTHHTETPREDTGSWTVNLGSQRAGLAPKGCLEGLAPAKRKRPSLWDFRSPLP